MTIRRKYRFVRKAARAQWYLGPWGYGFSAVSLVAVVFLAGMQSSFIAWSICAGVVVVLFWRWWQMHRCELEFWKIRSRQVVWLDGGRLHVSVDGAFVSELEAESLSLSDVRNVDALEERGKIVRLLVDKDDGTRAVYAGFDDMEAFASEFRLNTPQAKFRRVRLGFLMRLKEIRGT